MIKKTLVAAAVAAMMAGAAHADNSSVQLYGRLNLSYERQNVGGTTDQPIMRDNSSRFGITGTEQISSDLSALFLLEQGFAADTGVAPSQSFNRESYVGLSSKTFGTLRAGRILAPVYSVSADYISMHNHDTGTSSDALFGFQATGDNNNNTVAYKTPTYFGANVEAAYSMAEQNGQMDATNIALNYDPMENLQLGAGYARTHIKGQSGNDHMYVVRALYTIASFTVGAYYERDKFAEGSRNNYRLALKYELGRSEFHLNGGYAGQVGDISDSSAKQMTVAYNYNLSARTKLYAFYTRILNKANAGYAVANYGDDFSSFAVGLRHNF